MPPQHHQLLSIQDFPALALAGALIILVIAREVINKRRRDYLLPPGPPAKWFWQNPFPTSQIPKVLAELTNQYGPVFSLRQGNKVTVVIGRVQPTIDILEKEGGSTLSRPERVAARDLVSRRMRLILEPAGERFRIMRRAMHAPLIPKAAASYAPIQTEAAKIYIKNLLEQPDDHQHWASLFSASVVLKVTYGKTAPASFDDPDVKRILRSVINFANSMKPGAWAVDRMPVLRHIPWFTTKLDSWHQEEFGLFKEQMNGTKDAMKRGDDGPSFVRNLLEKRQEGITEDVIAYLAGSMYGAGTDTTSIAMSNTIMAAALYPEAQERMIEEIDLVLGDRAPSFVDMGTLPQLDAFTQEATRWRPVIPLGFPHRATTDIIWKGYRIPADATIVGNHWAISRDPEVYPDPERFNPQRWLDEKGSLKPSNEFRYWSFGFGRRVCPGQHLAGRSLFITLAMVFWCFRVSEDKSQPIDSDGFDDKMIAHAFKFKVKFEPRRSLEEIRAAIKV